MYLCSNDHEEVCFTASFCPLCEVYKQLEAVEQELKELRSELLAERAQD